jgi:hypothetical protein
VDGRGRNFVPLSKKKTAGQASQWRERWWTEVVGRSKVCLVSVWCSMSLLLPLLYALMDLLIKWWKDTLYSWKAGPKASYMPNNNGHV